MGAPPRGEEGTVPVTEKTSPPSSPLPLLSAKEPRMTEWHTANRQVSWLFPMARAPSHFQPPETVAFCASRACSPTAKTGRNDSGGTAPELHGIPFQALTGTGLRLFSDRLSRPRRFFYPSRKSRACHITTWPNNRRSPPQRCCRCGRPGCKKPAPRQAAG